ncbi:hypothetical protein NBG4_440018 [Candidatus Sulfobium mesophilum]|uniref:Uncharacterized protein n=1 Tax=Candidatus Sulfobium mesophilum TaxID=2016548 RepID=A0A2U3QIB3_9BACT|nr:hypothetical protein NBG4_440018 [Candidatus Sulfobium mesophilum]
MCGGCFPEDIIVCPVCKRDDEGYKTGDSDSPFVKEENGRLRCLCGHLFDPKDQGYVTGHS